MTVKTKQPFWALIVTKGRTEKVLTLLSDEYRAQAAKRIATTNGLEGQPISRIARVSVDITEVSPKAFAFLRKKARPKK